MFFFPRCWETPPFGRCLVIRWSSLFLLVWRPGSAPVPLGKTKVSPGAMCNRAGFAYLFNFLISDTKNLGPRRSWCYCTSCYLCWSTSSGAACLQFQCVILSGQVLSKKKSCLAKSTNRMLIMYLLYFLHQHQVLTNQPAASEANVQP